MLPLSLAGPGAHVAYRPVRYTTLPGVMRGQAAGLLLGTGGGGGHVGDVGGVCRGRVRLLVGEGQQRAGDGGSCCRDDGALSVRVFWAISPCAGTHPPIWLAGPTQRFVAASRRVLALLAAT